MVPPSSGPHVPHDGVGAATASPGRRNLASVPYAATALRSRGERYADRCGARRSRASGIPGREPGWRRRWTRTSRPRELGARRRIASRAIVAPHAGLMYSGPVAAYAYKRCDGPPYRVGRPRRTVALRPFRGVSIWPGGVVGDAVRSGRRSIAELAAAIAGRVVRDHASCPAAHAREHSLEMQLPFVAHLLPGVPIVPLVMGQQTRETADGARARRSPHAIARARRRRADRGQQRSLALRGCARPRRVARRRRHRATSRRSMPTG